MNRKKCEHANDIGGSLIRNFSQMSKRVIANFTTGICKGMDGERSQNVKKNNAEKMEVNKCHDYENYKLQNPQLRSTKSKVTVDYENEELYSGKCVHQLEFKDLPRSAY